MFNDKKISVVIPCLNEQQGLDYTLKKMPDFVNEVIVVDNGSTDNSIEIAGKYKKVRLFTEKTRGYGSALLKGLRNATGDILITMDADGSYPTCQLKDICIFLQENNLDFVSGCRFPLANYKSMPLGNRLGNYCISWIIRKFFNINIKDSQSGLVVFKKNILDKLILCNTGFGFCQEIKIRCWLEGKRCAEVNIPYNLRIGKVKFRKMKDSVKNIHNLLTLWIKMKQSRYPIK